ncbi:MAG TPA: ribonuclease Z [Chitinophagaceae bacterium]|nr:ribonuclease Z [Chitinophagaceae bacterium]
MLAVTILGSNSAIPAFGRHPTAQVVQNAEQSFLIDCGEGTQMQMTRYKIRSSKINHIFISHLHGDHYFGLIGLLTSMGLAGRKHELHLYAPETLKSIIDLQLQVASAHLPYELHFHPLKAECIILDDKKIIVECFKVKHRIECWGFLFKEKKNLRKINIDEVAKYNIPASAYDSLHMGENYITEDNTVIKNELVTLAVTPPKIYAYCADTLYDEGLIEKIKNVDLLYHEATYLHVLQLKAASRFHSTSIEAATIAKKAIVKKLLLGHFSSMYETLDEFKTEACSIFENTELAEEGICYSV